MAEHIGLEAIFGTEAFERGINVFMSRLADAVAATQSGGPAMGQAVSQGVDQMTAGTDRMAASMGQAGGGVDLFSQIAIGALRKIGEAAIQFLGQAISAMGEFVSGSFSMAMDAETNLARAEAVILAQGDAADMTIGQVEDLSMEYRDLAGGSHEAVVEIEAMALRMGNITRAQMPAFIQTVVDLAAVTGRDYPDAARMMAQAQLDPVSALRLFRAAGLAFTAEQREQITTLQRSGDEAGAFALVMERVSTATQGAAALMADTTAGRLSILRGHWETTREEFMAPFLPALETILEALTPAIDAFSRILGPASAGLATFSTAFGDAFGAVVDLLLGPSGVTDALGQVEEGTANAFAGLTGAVGTPVPGMAGINFAGLGAAGEQAFWSPERGWFTAMEDASTAVDHFSQDLEGVPTADPFQTLSDALARMGVDIAPAVALWYKLSGWWTTNGPIIQGAIEGVFAFLVGQIDNMVKVIGPFVGETLQSLSDWWMENGPLVEDAAGRVMTAIGTLFTWLTEQQGGAQAGTLDEISQALDRLLLTITLICQVITGDWSGAWETLKTIAIGTLNDVVAEVGGWATRIIEAFVGNWVGIIETWQGNWDLLAIIVGTIWDTIRTTVSTKISEVIGAISATIGGWAKIGSDLIGGLVKGITDAAGGVLTAVLDGVTAAWNAAIDFLHTRHSPSELFADIGRDTMAGLAEGILGGMAGPRRAVEVATAYAAAPGQAASQGVSAPALMGGVGDTYNNQTYERTNNVSIQGADLTNPFYVKKLFDNWLSGG